MRSVNEPRKLSFAQAGMAHSVIDRSATDARVQIEIPAKCDAIRGLLRAVVAARQEDQIPRVVDHLFSTFCTPNLRVSS